MPNTKILYLEAAKREMIDKFLSSNPGYFYRNEDGKIDCVKRMTADPPWAYIKPGLNQNCQFCHTVLFNVILEKKKVPIQCHSCWKVVLMPRDIEELFAAYLLIKELDIPGKCGTEGDRANTDRLYGAYFYNNSLQEGLECWKKVKAAVERDKVYESDLLGAPVKVKFGNGYDSMPNVILKRACTEFEQACGPSDQWTWDEEQQEIERITANSFCQDIMLIRQTDIQLSRLYYAWIHKAFQWGDQKYKMFTNYNRMYPPPVTYHDMDEEQLKEFIENGKKCS
jgi:hypothetical protein